MVPERKAWFLEERHGSRKKRMVPGRKAWLLEERYLFLEEGHGTWNKGIIPEIKAWFSEEMHVFLKKKKKNSVVPGSNALFLEERNGRLKNRHDSLKNCTVSTRKAWFLEEKSLLTNTKGGLPILKRR